MFLIPKSSFKKFNPKRCCFVLNEFAAAEFSSAVEMLFAAKVVNNKKLSDGFIRHALDEYKHYFIFTNIKNQIISEYKINKKESKDNFFSKINLTNNFTNETATKLIEGEIIASYYGPNEVGPRSLGNTSIFCDARNKEAVINLNLNLKKRGYFQPLAPILLEKDFEKYFSINKSIVKNLEWMGTLCDAKEELYNKYNSIIHVDGTCRAQIVKDEDSLTYKVLTNLKKSGLDILVNTSFNISKDPVVFDLYDVYVNMKRMNIKIVLMDDGLYQTKDI